MKRNRLPLLGFVLSFSTISSALADGSGRYHDYGMMSGGWFFGPIMMLLFIGLVVGAVVITIRILGFNSSNRSSYNSLDTLKERFAKGEIDKDEFEERKRILKS